MQQMTPQMMGYDRAITVFSPDGRLFQVHYAQEAVRRGATVMGLKSREGIALLVDKRISTKLLEVESIEKIFKIDDHIGAVASGLVADGRALVDRARVEAQINYITYGEPMNTQVLAKKISDHIQTLTQYGGVRPYGSALLIAGVDETGPRLFETDPSGALYEYKAVSIGANRNVVMEMLENEYKVDMTMDEVIALGIKALFKSMEAKGEKPTIEIGLIDTSTRKFRKLTEDEVQEYITKAGFTKADLEKQGSRSESDE
ncbi:proteasome endopeptidase complex, archaeal, alpha subunit [Methanocella sp. CWC-04]|uniref:Proteasome subunit alpha n=1 Tax=Methanooceanicella nereidis TaxID=2052831 RepID=A0AAP2RF22_9EURY|nr:archaeal proteasome endopeptidase complex subunit alpha [Methanocella sp. CWC-04]MCD1296148.1 proteasome endopeptidase complex, archaeal, alpha subunit [Methanocella sp. CWC-04]